MMKRISKILGLNADEKAQAQEVNPAAAPVESQYGLNFSFEDGKTQTYKSLPLTIGRSPESQIVVNDPTVSARHALVYFDPRLQQVCIADLDSANGLLIDEQLTRRNVLLDNVKIRVGNTHIVFRDTGFIYSGEQESA